MYVSCFSCITVDSIPIISVVFVSGYRWVPLSVNSGLQLDVVKHKETNPHDHKK